MSDLNDAIQGNVLEAQILSRKHLVLELDFSFGSIEELEAHIDTVDYAVPGGKSEENLVALTRAWGCYLGESLRRQVGGEWVRDDADKNQGIALRVDQQTLYPLEQVRKRLVDGEAFNVATYFKQVRDRA
ncbi:MAG: DUF3806 domain-containing protein [Pirellulaceae bacterium]